MSDTVLVTREHGVALVTLNRPERLNAINSELMEYLPSVLRGLAADATVGCVVLTGAGRGFCAGGDLKSRQEEHDAMNALPPEQRAATAAPYLLDAALLSRVETSRLLHDMAKPTIAMVNGPCAGAGFSMAGACDMRFAAESAVFTSAFTRAGLSGDFGGTWFWSQILGTAKARELYFLSERIEARRALALGMVSQVFGDAELHARTMEIARRIADGPRWSFAYAKRNLNAAEDTTMDRVMQMEAMSMGLAARTTRESGFMPSSVLKKGA